MNHGEPDIDVLEIQQSQAKKRKVFYAVIGTVVLLGGGGIAFGIWQSAAANAAEVAEAWNQASACVVGKPVASPEEAPVRFRNSQLTAMGLSEDKRGEPGQDPWPRSCVRALHGVAEAVESAGQSAALIHSARDLAKGLDRPLSFMEDMSKLLVQTWKDAAELGLTASTADGPRAPAPKQPLTQDTLPAEARFLPGMVPLESLKTESTPGGRLMFVVDDKSAANLPALCTATQDGKKLECKKLPDSLRRVCPGLKLFGTSEDSVPPFVFAGDRGQAGIYRSTDGKQVAQALTYGASALKDGSLVRTVWHEEDAEVWYAIHSPDGRTKETKVLDYDEVGNPYYNSGLFWDWLVYKAWNKDSIKLYARKVKADGTLEDVAQVGELRQRSLIMPDEERPHITACRTSKAFVIRVKGSNEQYTAFHLGDQWMPPVPSPGIEGELTCSEHEAVITHLVPQPRNAWIYQTRCTPAACKRASVSFRDLLQTVMHLNPEDRKHLTAAELDGQLLMLWGAGEKGGLRMRLGPADQIMKVQDQVLYDDLVENGKLVNISTLLATRVISGSKYALLFLSTTKGVFVFNVNASGKLSPVRTVFK